MLSVLGGWLVCVSVGAGKTADASAMFPGLAAPWAETASAVIAGGEVSCRLVCGLVVRKKAGGADGWGSG